MTRPKPALSGGSLALPDDNAHPSPMEIATVTELGRKSRPRSPVDNDDESDGVQADDEPPRDRGVPAGLTNVDTRRSLIEDRIRPTT